MDQLQVTSTYTTIDLSDMEPNSEWDIIETTAAAFGVIDGVPEAGFILRVKVKREPAFYIMNIVLPTMLMSGVSLLVFLSPSKAEEKTVLAVTVFLSFTVYSTVVVNNVPKAGSTPLLSKQTRTYFIQKPV